MLEIGIAGGVWEKWTWLLFLVVVREICFFEVGVLRKSGENGPMWRTRQKKKKKKKGGTGKTVEATETEQEEETNKKKEILQWQWKNLQTRVLGG